MKHGQQVEEVILLYLALVRPCLENSVKLWCSQGEKNIDLLLQVHKRATEVIRGLDQPC